jgi:outer membrane protein OmpA-like peptidoglycan-associated protein
VPGAASAPEPQSGLSESARRWFDPAHRRLSASPTGETGLRNTLSAAPGMPGLRVGLATEWFTASSFLAPADRNTRLAGALTGAYVPKGAEFLEIFGLYRNVSNRNTANTPELILTQGDVTLGVKAGYTLPFEPLRRSLVVGADFSVSPRVAVNNLVLDPGATSVDGRLLASWDARPIWAFVPAVAHLNAGWATPAVLTLPGGRQPSCIDSFAGGMSRYHRALLSLGVESPLPYVTPYLEGHVELPVGVTMSGDQPCPVHLPEGQTALRYGDIVPAVLATGLRVTALREVTFDVGGEFGLTRSNYAGVRATPPWQLFASATYAFDPWKEPEVREVVQEKIVERVQVKVETREVEKVVRVVAEPTTGRLSGTVTDAASGAVIEGAIVSFPATKLPPVATDAAAGRYLTHELPPGPVALSIRHPRFETLAATGEVKLGVVTPQEFKLTRLIVPGRLRAVVRDAKGAPLARARVTVVGAKPLVAVTDAAGEAELELQPGNYRLRVDADGRLAKPFRVKLAEAEKVLVSAALRETPKKPAATMTPTGISLARKLAFPANKAVLGADAMALLDEVLDLLARAPAERKLSVSGHVNDRVKKDRQQALSLERAQAVRDYLLAQGLAGELVDAAGLGATRPLSPGKTPKAREKNERIDLEFVAP